jgi:hypothetical protein
VTRRIQIAREFLMTIPRRRLSARRHRRQDDHPNEVHFPADL